MKRLKILCVVFAVAISLLTSRIFYLCTVKNKAYTKSVMAQRTQYVEFKSPGGIIYDRNMIKITNADMRLVVKDGTPYYVDTRKNNILSHVIGYISPDGKGSGIEGAFDYVLSSDNNSTISYLKDINNNKISEGYSVNTEKNYAGVSLTINYHIQKITEQAMDKFSINGAAVVADCQTGEILAMASRPNYDASSLADYLDGTDGELLNKSILQYNPGSVFKIIAAAAFIENHYNDEMRFNCTGKTEIDGIEFVCHKEEGHGVQTLEEAFANSCNCAFYEIGAIVGIDEIHQYAAEFGIGTDVLHINSLYEDSGYVPEYCTSNADMANISIGQGNVMVTPLQIADILCTVCNGGTRNQLALIKGIVDSDGLCMSTDTSQLGRITSETTSRRLLEMMNTAVSDGTGSSAMPNLCTAGGKTGSAETGWEKDGELMQQGWFAGYFPADSPQYVCVVIAENGISGSESACPVFREIADGICNNLGIFNK